MEPIDLRSDTVTQPSNEMRAAVINAELGDDSYSEDPTVKKLEDRVADLLGREDALYFPTGTMANQAAIQVHTDPGEMVICDEKSHIYRSEASGIVEWTGVQLYPIDGGDRGIPRPEQIKIANENLNTPPDSSSTYSTNIGLLTLENTHNARGGLAIEPGRINDSTNTAAQIDVPTHLDGARLWNAAVALDIPISKFTEGPDSVMVSLSKGLGAPVGSLLVGDRIFIEEARKVRKQMGGAMGQAGIIAAPGISSLNNIEELEKDHRNAAYFAAGISEIDNMIVQNPETNIIIVDISDIGLAGEEFIERLRMAGVLGTLLGDHLVRFVTHRDIDKDDIEIAIEHIKQVF